MALTMERIKKYRRWFGWAFVASLVLVMAVAVFAESRLFSVALVTSLTAFLGFVVTALMSLGFVVTKLMSWRKERRESNHAGIELEKKQLELEKLRREIGDKNAAAQEKKKKTSKRRRVV